MERLAKGKVTYKTGQNLEPIAQAITYMGQSANKKDKPIILGQKIRAISTDTTAIEENVLNGQTFFSGGNKKTGSMPNRGAWTNRLEINGKIAISPGYHNGSGYIDQSIATKEAQIYTPSTVNQTIGAGQYLSGDQIISGDPNLKPENIAKGKTIFGVTGSFYAADDYYLIKRYAGYQNGFSLTGIYVGQSTRPYLDRDGSMYSGNIILKVTENSGNYWHLVHSARSDELIDVTSFRKLKVTMSMGTSSNDFTIGLVSSENLNRVVVSDFHNGSSASVFASRVQGGTSAYDDYVCTIDVTNLSGGYYFVVGYRGRTSSSISELALGDVWLTAGTS